MENPPFVNEFPIQKGEFPASYVRLPKCKITRLPWILTTVDGRNPAPPGMYKTHIK